MKRIMCPTCKGLRSEEEYDINLSDGLICKCGTIVFALKAPPPRSYDTRETQVGQGDWAEYRKATSAFGAGVFANNTSSKIPFGVGY